MTDAERVKLWVKEHPERSKAIKAKYREKNREKLRLEARAYDATHPNRYRVYYQKNKKTIVLKSKLKRQTDIQARLRNVLGSRIRIALKGLQKAESTVKLFGCSLVELKQHLESKFLPGMFWENYGIRGWHVDHIKPCKAFDLSDPEQQKQCFHYSNLQPLWAKDNLRKGAGEYRVRRGPNLPVDKLLIAVV